VILLPPLAAVTHRGVRAEERRLAAAFGVEYEAYRARVRRYV
jgi:protein-S-isoprenylcysteine O-methyltransferase Ste14